MTIDDLTMMRDYELRALATPEADEVLTTRSRAARRVVLTMARALGRIERKWGHLLPFRTDMGTIGIVDTTLGTAWDTTIPAGPEVSALGLPPLDGVHAVTGTRSRGGTSAAPTAPPGWRQIAPREWWGWGEWGEVPVAEYQPETWVEPRLVRTGLMTCYGRPGADLVSPWLDDGSEEWKATLEPPRIQSAGAWEYMWPHGVPGWLRDCRSVTVLDVIAWRHAGRGPKPLGWARGTDAEEAERLRPLLTVWRETTAVGLHRAAREVREDRSRYERWYYRGSDRQKTRSALEHPRGDHPNGRRGRRPGATPQRVRAGPCRRINRYARRPGNPARIAPALPVHRPTRHR